MAGKKTLHELAIEIQGGVDASFGNSISSVQGKMSDLSKKVKEISDGNNKIGKLDSAFVKSAVEADKYNKQLSQLQLSQRDIASYEKQKMAIGETNKRFAEAEQAVKKYEQSHAAAIARIANIDKQLAAEGTGKEQKKALLEQRKAATEAVKAEQKALQGARKESAAISKSYEKEKKALTNTEKKLKDNNISVSDLSKEQKRLAREIENVGKASETAAAKMEKITKVKAAVAGLKEKYEGLKGSIKGAAASYAKIGAGLLATSLALYKVTDSTAAAGDIAVKTSQKLGMTAEAFQELDYAAKLSGVDNMSGAIETMNMATARAIKGQGKAVKAIKELGISAKQLQKMGPEKSIMVLGDELNKIKDPAKRARIQLGLFGTDGSKMGLLLSQGSKGMQALRDEAKKIGIVIPTEAARAGEAFNDARDKMRGSVAGIRNVVGKEFLPVFTETFLVISDFIVENKATIEDFAKTVVVKFREALPEMKAFAKGGVKAISFMWNLAKVITRLVGGAENLSKILLLLPLVKVAWNIGRVVGAVWNVVSALGGLGTIISVVTKLVTANPMGLVIMGIAAAVYVLYKNWDTVKVGFSIVVDSIKSKTAALKANILYVLGEIPKALKGILVGIKDTITEPFTAAFDMVATGWAKLKGVFGKTDIAPAVSIAKASQPITTNARGGMVSSPTLSTLAERGPEIVVPAGRADRSRGLAALKLASHSLGVESNGIGRGNSGAFKAGNITVAPVFHISGNGGDDISQKVLAALESIGPKIIAEWQEQIARVSYGTS